MTFPLTTTASVRQGLRHASLIVWLATSAAWAQGPGPASKGPMTPQAMQKIHELRVERLAKRINATPEQKQQLLQIQQRDNAQIAAIQAQLSDVRKRENVLLSAAKFDRSAMEQLQRERASLQAQQQSLREKQRLDGAEVLTPEQRAKLGTHGAHMFGHPGKQYWQKKD